MIGQGRAVPYTAMETNTTIKLNLIAKKAHEEPRLTFTSLIHLLVAPYLMECYHLLKKGKAAGIDGRTKESYSDEEIVHAIEETAARIQSKTYRPQPVRRVYIEKGNGKKRPLGIPSVIDKVVQLGITRILETIHEQDFLSLSYGYRPGRGAHECEKEINHMIMGKKVNWIIDADIQGFFDHIDHSWMMRCLDQRIADPNFKRLINRFLKAGVMEEGRKYATEEGTPQGGILSPVLANMYLHYVLDLWVEKKLKKSKRGYIQLIRYADDFVIGVQYKEEADQICHELTERMKKFALTLSEEKTRVIEFGRFAAENRKKRGERKPETFDFLGFTHYCTTTRDGRYMVRVKTSRKKMNGAITAVNIWLKRIRHIKEPQEIWQTIGSKLQGHYNYYGMSGNFESINRYYQKTRRLIFKWMNRRGQRKSWSWEGFLRHLDTYPLPKPRLTYAVYNTW